MDNLNWTPYPSGSDPILFDVRGHRRTASLFKEKTQDQNCPPIFSLKDYDSDLPSAYLIYMSAADEYDAAMKMVGSMAHWRKLLNLTWFMEGEAEASFAGLDSWRQDMAARDASLAKQVLMDKLKNDEDVNAAKHVLTNAIKGHTAGLATPRKAPSIKSKKRGTQSGTADVVNLDERFQALKENN